MNIKEYTESIVNKLKKNPQFYSEISEERLKDILERYLDDFYNEKISDILASYKDRKQKGEEINQEEYRGKIDKAKSELYKRAYDLAKTVK